MTWMLRNIVNAGLCSLYLCFSLFFLPVVAGAEELPASILGKDGMEMQLVPAGFFFMGSRGEFSQENEKPRHKVFLKAFYIDRYEVTSELFARFLNEAGIAGANHAMRRDWVIIRDDTEGSESEGSYPAPIRSAQNQFLPARGFEKYPVYNVTWHGAQAYCRWAGRRLPTEAEWEKAARGGLEDMNFPWGNEIPVYNSGVIFGRMWDDKATPPPLEKTGNYPPNGFGIFDMAGNVAEWCSDWYDASYYKNSPDRNPQGPEKSSHKVVRGGSWSSAAMQIRVAYRDFVKPRSRAETIGFRCVQSAPSEQ